RKLQRGKDEIELAYGSTADKSNSPFGSLPQSRQRIAQRMRHEHLARGRGEVENRSVHVEEDGKSAKRGGERRNGFGHRECGSPAVRGGVQLGTCKFRNDHAPGTVPRVRLCSNSLIQYPFRTKKWHIRGLARVIGTLPSLNKLIDPEQSWI